MMRVRQGPRPEEIRQGAKHVLFVEGHDDNSFDVTVLREFFDHRIRVEPLGPSYSVKSVAQALYHFHPFYYFLIDRDDHHEDDHIERCWDEFPDPNTHNLLIWRFREIENYFLLPDYLMNSDHLNRNRVDLESEIIRLCQSRIHLDAANSVIVSIREELKRP